MQKLFDWLREAAHSIKYGTIHLTINVHQGQIASIEKQIIEKENYDIKKVDKKSE